MCSPTAGAVRGRACTSLVGRHRLPLDVYHEQTEPLKDYYADRGILTTVDATQGIPDVTQVILDGITAVQDA